ncbi:MAG: hypothetical protein ABIL45_04155 [candidate division WOR-3 bacterium]
MENKKLIAEFNVRYLKRILKDALKFVKEKEDRNLDNVVFEIHKDNVRYISSDAFRLFVLKDRMSLANEPDNDYKVLVPYRIAYSLIELCDDAKKVILYKYENEYIFYCRYGGLLFSNYEGYPNYDDIINDYYQKCKYPYCEITLRREPFYNFIKNNKKLFKDNEVVRLKVEDDKLLVILDNNVLFQIFYEYITNLQDELQFDFNININSFYECLSVFGKDSSISIRFIRKDAPITITNINSNPIIITMPVIC